MPKTTTQTNLTIAAANLWNAFTSLNSAYINEVVREEDTTPSKALALSDRLTPRIAAVYSAVASLRAEAKAQLGEGGRT
jgi:hypothetical protein